MNIFARPEYQSEFTLFLNDHKLKQPTIAERQRTGLALLWDKTPIDLADRQRASESQVRRNAYVYE